MWLKLHHFSCESGLRCVQVVILCVTSSDFCCCMSCRSPVNQAVNYTVWWAGVGGGGTSVHCIHCCLVLVVVSLEPHSFSGRVVLSLQSFRNGQNHSLNNIPWNLACAYCPVSPSCEPGNPAGHTLFVCCLPQCYVCLFQANHCCCCWKH